MVPENGETYPNDGGRGSKIGTGLGVLGENHWIWRFFGELIMLLFLLIPQHGRQAFSRGVDHRVHEERDAQ